MPRQKSYDGSADSMPVSVRRAAEVDRTYYDQAACIGTNINGKAWFAKAGKKYKIGGQLYDGGKLLEMALLVCRSCPVQWECAAGAIYTPEPIGVWGDLNENLRWLGRRPDHETRLQMAKSTGVPVQDLVDILKAGRSNARRPIIHP